MNHITNSRLNHAIPKTSSISGSHVNPSPTIIFSERQTLPDVSESSISLDNIRSGSGVCPYCYTYKTRLKSHIQIVHKKMWRYSCSLCGKKLSVLTNVKSHLQHTHKMSDEEIGRFLFDGKHMPARNFV